MSRSHVIVAGSPGAMCAQVSLTLANSGYELNWPSQDMDVGEATRYAAQGTNVEIVRCHLQILQEAKTEWTSLQLPLFYSPPYPGPAEIINKYSKDAVLSERLLPLFLNLWQPYVVAVIDIRATVEEDLKALRSWTGGTLADAYLQKLAAAYRERYTGQLVSCGRVFGLTNGEIRSSKFDGLTRFLGSLP